MRCIDLVHTELTTVVIPKNRPGKIDWLLPWVRRVLCHLKMLLLRCFSNLVGILWAACKELYQLLGYHLPTTRSLKCEPCAFCLGCSGESLNFFFSSSLNLELSFCFLLTWHMSFHCLRLSLKGLL